jgi:hypothetical protein
MNRFMAFNGSRWHRIAVKCSNSNQGAFNSEQQSFFNQVPGLKMGTAGVIAKELDIN